MGERRETRRLIEGQREVALRAAEASRTYRRAFSAASDLSRIYEAIGIAGWRYFSTLVSMPGSPISRGTAMRAIRSPRGVMEDLPKSPRRPRQADALSRAGFKGPTGSSAPPQCNACRPARNLLGFAGVRANLYPISP